MKNVGYYLFNVVQFYCFRMLSKDDIIFQMCDLMGSLLCAFFHPGLLESRRTQDAGLRWSHGVLTPPHPPLPVQTHLLCLPLGRRKIIRYFNGCQICFPNLLKGYRCYTRTSAYIWINVNFVTREIYCLPGPTTVLHKLNRHVFTKCSSRVIYMAGVTDCSLIEREKNTYRRGAMKA